MDLPSVFKEGTTLYDDFVYGHSKTGSYSHYAASFLPWHRMYIHVYERALRYHCGYSESLPYVPILFNFSLRNCFLKLSICICQQPFGLMLTLHH